jgi:flagellar hook assembly protein FlgD
LITGLRKEGKAIPKEFKLYKNNPDPFAGSTAIRFDIPASNDGKEVTLTIYDATGKEVGKLVQDKLKAGSYVVNWDAGNYTRGVYLYQIKAEGFVLSMRMLLVK